MQFSWKKIEHTSMNAKSKMSYITNFTVYPKMKPR